VVLSVYVFIPLHFAPTYLIAASGLYTIGGFIYGLPGERVPRRERRPRSRRPPRTDPLRGSA
jgi:hypothetical protein